MRRILDGNSRRNSGHISEKWGLKQQRREIKQIHYLSALQELKLILGNPRKLKYICSKEFEERSVIQQRRYDFHFSSNEVQARAISV